MFRLGVIAARRLGHERRHRQRRHHRIADRPELPLAVTRRIEAAFAPGQQRQPLPGQRLAQQEGAARLQPEIRRDQHHPVDLRPQHRIARRKRGQRAPGRGADQHHLLADPMADGDGLGQIAGPVRNPRLPQRGAVHAVPAQPREIKIGPAPGGDQVGDRADFLRGGGKAVDIDQGHRGLCRRTPGPDDPARDLGADAAFLLVKPGVEVFRQFGDLWRIETPRFARTDQPEKQHKTEQPGQNKHQHTQHRT